jgi:phospholipid/cholesterol/gamma-HCH transport system substrate-binding protein
VTITRKQKIRLGIFAVSTAVLVVAVLVIFAGVRFWERENRYVVDIEGSVLGLASGSDVLLNGVKVGSIDDLAISPDDIRKVRATLLVEEGTPIKSDTRAVLVMRGITGLRVIDLRGGTDEAAALSPGSKIPSERSDMEKLVERADEIADRSLQVLDTADRALGSAARVSAELEGMVAENRALVRGTLGSVNAASRSAARLVDGELKQMIASASALVNEMSGVVKQNQSQLRAALGDLRRASGNFKELSRELRQRPSALLFSKPPPDRRLP